MAKGKDDLSPQTRAEDILLGSLGFGEDARIVSIESTETGYSGVGVWICGEQFSFESEDDLDPLQLWALGVFMSKGSK